MIKLIAVVMMLSVCQAFADGPVPSPSLDVYQIGHTFGGGHWAFGFDKSSTVGGCVQREVHDGQWLGGPCRDLFLLVKDGQPRWHLGASVMYNAEHGNASYGIRAGFNVGPLAKSALVYVVDKVPYLEQLGSVRTPKFLVYIGGITTVDYSVGYRPVHGNDVVGNLTHGPMVKMDIPLEDVYALIKLGL